MVMDLHDQVLQDLFTARHWLEQAQEAFFSEQAAEAHEVLKIAGYLRGLLFELRPPAWDHSELATMLEDYALTLEEKHGLTVVFESNGNGDGLSVPEEAGLVLYRILQESLNNAKKHAQAEEVEIILDLQPDKVILEVRDDSVGFEVPSHLGAHIKRGHLGLVGMRERVGQVGGILDIKSQPGQGTRILVNIPVPSPHQ